MPNNTRLLWRSVASKVLYSLSCDKVKDEIAGEWLNEKTNTGMVNQMVIKKPLAVGNCCKEAEVHSGIR